MMTLYHFGAKAFNIPSVASIILKWEETESCSTPTFFFWTTLLTLFYLMYLRIQWHHLLFLSLSWMGLPVIMKGESKLFHSLTMSELSIGARRKGGNRISDLG